MRLPFEVVLLIPTTLSAPLSPRSASFSHLTGLTPLSRDYSTSDKRFPSKYFHEATFHPHYDGRFAASVLPQQTRAFHMRLLLRSYTAAMERIGVRTWIMHGSLLGWWWNGLIFPWDSDLDFCVEKDGMSELGGWWNMTVHHFSSRQLGLIPVSTLDSDTYINEPGPQRIAEPPGLVPGVWNQVLVEGKKYLLEINPHYIDSSTSDTDNVIDARWIDTSTGLFIDITTVHPVPSSATAKSAAKHQIFLAQSTDANHGNKQNEEHHKSQRPQEMYTKDTHLYTTASLFPLRRATFEGTRVYVPYAYETLLLEEYGPQALTDTRFNRYRFDREKKDWVVASDMASTSLPGVGSGRG